MAKQFTAERRNQLAQLIISEGHVTIAEAAKKFNVSIETIRKDMIVLQDEGIINKTHGGALPSPSALEKPVFQKGTENREKKQRIALKALDLVPKNGTLILDSGTTTQILADYLKLESHLTIFTNNASTFASLAESHNKVFLFGGELRPSSLAVIGKWANEQILSIRADAVFLGSDGFNGFSGPTTTSFEEAEVKTNFLNISQNTILLADSSKFIETSLFQFATWDQIDTFITDDGIHAKSLAALSKKTTMIVV